MIAPNRQPWFLNSLISSLRFFFFFFVLKLDFLQLLSPRPLKRGDTAECAALISLIPGVCRSCWSRLLEESCGRRAEGSSEQTHTELKVMLRVIGQ